MANQMDFKIISVVHGNSDYHSNDSMRRAMSQASGYESKPTNSAATCLSDPILNLVDSPCAITASPHHPPLCALPTDGCGVAPQVSGGSRTAATTTEFGSDSNTLACREPRTDACETSEPAGPSMPTRPHTIREPCSFISINRAKISNYS